MLQQSDQLITWYCLIPSKRWSYDHTAQIFLTWECHHTAIGRRGPYIFQLMNGWLWKRLVNIPLTSPDPWLVWGKPSLKLTFSHLKIHCWKMKFPVEKSPFSRNMLIFRECTLGPQKNPWKSEGFKPAIYGLGGLNNEGTLGFDGSIYSHNPEPPGREKSTYRFHVTWSIHHIKMHFLYM